MQSPQEEARCADQKATEITINEAISLAVFILHGYVPQLQPLP